VIRDEVVAFASSLANLGACPHNVEARDRYLTLIAPHETEARAAEMATMSGCELVTLGIWREFIDHPLLARPYVGGKAGQNLLALALRAGAATPFLNRWPEIGDALIVGGPAGGGSEHAWTSLSISTDPYADPGPRETHGGLDGGQIDDDGAQVIRLREHELHAGVDTTDTYARKVQWVLNIEKIVARFGRR
jgi:hypothetical protein